MFGVSMLKGDFSKKTGLFKISAFDLFIFEILFRVSGTVCCDGFAMNPKTGMCESKC